MNATSPSAAAAVVDEAARLWQTADAAALHTLCSNVPDAALSDWPQVARWRALAAMLSERDDALACLEQAHAGHLRAGQLDEAALDAHIALAQCLIDIGTMDAVTVWVQRSAMASLLADLPAPQALWVQLGRVARAVLDPAHADQADDALAALQARLSPLAAPLAPHERLLVAQMLINGHFARQRYEQFDLVAALVQQPVWLAAAPALLQARWHYTLGFAYYQVGRADAAQTAWQQALGVASEAGHSQLGLMASLALMRLWLDRGQLDDASRLEADIQTSWGAGRTTMLMELQQMRARMWLLRGQAVRAQATLAEAMALAHEAGLSVAEQASLQTDQAQLLVALGREEDALALLQRLSQDHAGRDAAVYRCLHDLLQAWVHQRSDEALSRECLMRGLQGAQDIRYAMFYRLLPELAARLCALALRSDVEPGFVLEVITTRGLRAPAEADARWPWPLWLSLLGGFEIRLHGQPWQRPGKLPQKPLELLRLLGCQRQLSLATRVAADALWPEADGAAALKSLEMAVQRLRRLLADDSLVQVGDGSVALDAARVSSDVVQRRRLIDALESQTLPAPDLAQQARLCTQLARRVLSGPRGRLLPWAPDAPWLEAERRLCDQELLRGARALGLVLARGGYAPDLQAALADALQALGSGPV
jgi:tetratricopeptide (TPR) repeat protein